MINDWFPWLDSQKSEKIKQFKSILLKFNDSINLISPNTVKNIDVVHLADCIMAGSFVIERLGDKPTHDLGSGNGFPGIIFGILANEKKFVLVDRDIKKIEFLRHVVNELKLINVACEIKNIGQDQSVKIEQSISRAMAPMGRVLKSSKDCFDKGGKIYLMKTNKWESELATDHVHLEKIWQWRVVHEYSLPQDEGKRVIIEAVKL
jgi:16S rRNA (guanine527-N7)-methyltransferase